MPEAVNDLIRRKGLTKMGSDFAVPIRRNADMLKVYREALDAQRMLSLAAIWVGLAVYSIDLLKSTAARPETPLP